MTPNSTCPHSAQIRSMLEGELAEHELSRLAAHIEACEICQKRFDTLSEEMGLGLGDAGRASQGGSPVSAVLQPIIERLRSEGLPAEGAHESVDETIETNPTAGCDVSLDFLAPSSQPEHLGRLGPYEVTELIGQGGMGLVLRAHDPKLNRTVAIKVLSPQLAYSATARTRFMREARAAAAVSHDHVVTIHAVDEANHIPFLVMEYIDGVSLDHRIKRDGPLRLREILRIGMQAASGLAAAHAQGLVHRDVKPSNILLENGVERVKITDFGLARAAQDAQITKTGVVAGTPEYMSPEQARGETVDHRTDLFSLGCVLYAMCTGRSPFRATTAIDAIRRVCDDTPRPIREINPEIPEWLVTIIDRILAKAPEQRFESTSEVAELLGAHLAHLQRPADVPKPTMPPTFAAGREQGPPGRPRRVRWAAATAILALVGLFVLTEVTGITSLLRPTPSVNRNDPPPKDPLNPVPPRCPFCKSLASYTAIWW